MFKNGFKVKKSPRTEVSHPKSLSNVIIRHKERYALKRGRRVPFLFMVKQMVRSVDIIPLVAVVPYINTRYIRFVSDTNSFHFKRRRRRCR